MSNVCVVVEHWSNCEEYDLEENDKKILCVAGNPTIAEQAILNRCDDLIKIAEKSRECVWTKETGESKNMVLSVDFTHNMTDNIFHTIHNCGRDSFYWSIEDHEIIDS